MKKLPGFWFALPACIIMSTSILMCNEQKNTIFAKIDGLGNDTVFVEYVTIAEMEEAREITKDTILAKENRFEYNLKEKENVMMVLEPSSLIRKRINGVKYQSDSRMIMLVVKPDDKIKIAGTIEKNYDDYRIKGSDFNRDNAANRVLYKAQNIKLDSISMCLDYYHFSKETLSNRDSIIKTLNKERTALNREKAAINLAYIKDNLDTDLAGYYLTRQPIDKFASYFNKLNNSVKQNGLLKAQLSSQINNYEKYILHKVNKLKIITGSDAPDFTLKNLAENDYTLSSLKGKYIVLDFWGSWYDWCIKDFPMLKKYYGKYNDKIEFIGVACNDRDKEWRAAIEKIN